MWRSLHEVLVCLESEIINGKKTKAGIVKTSKEAVKSIET
jgi:hypothetical protein